MTNRSVKKGDRVLVWVTGYGYTGRTQAPGICLGMTPRRVKVRFSTRTGYQLVRYFALDNVRRSARATY